MRPRLYILPFATMSQRRPYVQLSAGGARNQPSRSDHLRRRSHAAARPVLHGLAIT